MVRFAVQADRSVRSDGSPIEVLVYVGCDAVASTVSPAVIPQTGK